MVGGCILLLFIIIFAILKIRDSRVAKNANPQEIVNKMSNLRWGLNLMMLGLILFIVAIIGYIIYDFKNILHIS